MSKLDLETYISWLLAQRLLLQEKINSASKVSKKLSLELIGKERESERMILIRSGLRVKGYSSDPGLFLAQLIANVDLLNSLNEEQAAFESYLDSLGGSFTFKVM